MVAVVSDGAGSAEAGGIGADVACGAFYEVVTRYFELGSLADLSKGALVAWTSEIRRAIAAKAVELGLPIRELACTLLAAIVGERKSAFVQIGDGAIVISSGQVLGVVFWPDSGEYANMTNFLTGEDALDNMNVQIVERQLSEIALFSDGIQRLALNFESQVPHHPFFDPMFKALRERKAEECDELDGQLALFLEKPQVNQRTDDDKTLVLATER